MPHEILHVILHALLETLKPAPLLLLAYLLMELLEHKAGERVEKTVQRSGRVGPLVGALLGLLPQCGFSTVASGFYAGGVITTGTLLAVFLSTSDEMLAIFLSGGVSPRVILTVLGLKLLVAVVAGFAADLLLCRRKRPLEVHELCDREGCHCDRGVWRSALHHTLHVTLFVLIVNLALGLLLHFVPLEELLPRLAHVPFLLPLVSALIGLIPNCAASVAIATLYLEGVFTAGTMLAGLLAGAGTGLLVLFRLGRNRRRLLIFLPVLLLIGTVSGFLLDFTGLAAWLGI